MTKDVRIYCDGACSGNPGIGGWGAVLLWKETRKEISGALPFTTNNRMELTAAIESIKAIKRDLPIAIYTDSQYVVQGMNTWILKWKLNNWSYAEKKAIKNLDLWQELDKLVRNFSVDWNWVKGHNGNILNERADYLAKHAITLLQNQHQ